MCPSSLYVLLNFDEFLKIITTKVGNPLMKKD